MSIVKEELRRGRRKEWTKKREKVAESYMVKKVKEIDREN